MGGVHPAYEYVKQALQKGKSVVTSNKELVAAHGASLITLARENNVNFLFEASVGGGIPIVRSMMHSLTADEVEKIEGILNGTTNYILTKMSRENKGYHESLAEAQALGYAEKNPAADVEGHDTCRKLAILLSLASGKTVDYRSIPTEGITNVTPEDIAYANAMGGSVKLLAVAERLDDHYYARVSPVIVQNISPLYRVDDVFNAVMVEGDCTDRLMFYGKGAGKKPTATAIVADLVDAGNALGRHIPCIWEEEALELLPLDKAPTTKLVRVGGTDEPKLMAALDKCLPGFVIVTQPVIAGEMAFVTPRLPEADLRVALAKLAEAGFPILGGIRVDG